MNSAGTRGTLYTTWRNASGGIVSGPTASTAHFKMRWDDRYQDTVRRKKPADLFANGTNVSHSSYTVHQSLVTYKDPNDGLYKEAPIGNFILYGTSTLIAPTTELDGNLRAQIKSSNLNLAQSCAEYRQTSSMFANLARDIHRTYHDLKLHRYRTIYYKVMGREGIDGNRLPRHIANRWLEYQYGLKPLLSDIYGATDALASKIRTGFPQHVRATRSYQYYERRGHGLPFSGMTPVVSHNRIRAVARYTIRDAGIKQLTQLGITNPLLLAWELIPYSFVVDWMFPVGRFLESLDALNGVSNLIVVRSRMNTQSLDASFGGGSISMKYRQYERYLNATLALPRLRYEPSKSLTAVTNGLALLTQLRLK